MSDQKLGQPVRTEADADERVQVKVVDGTTVAQKMTVDTDGNAHAEMHGNDPGATDRVLRTSEQGAISVDGKYNVTNNTIPSNAGKVLMQRNDTPVEAHQTLRQTGVPNAAGDVRSSDVAIHHADGEDISETNPLHVVMAENPGVEVVDFDTAAALAAAATSNHDYVVTALKTLLVDRVIFAASSRGKVEVQVEDGVAAGTYTTVAVKFITSSKPEADVVFDRRLKVAAGVNIRIARTNRDNQAQDVYSTVVGIEV